MNKEIPMGIDPKIKKEINEEGFEDNAAVLIGKKEEMPQLKERMEKEGNVENLGTYIKLHKEISLPKEGIDPEFIEEINKNKGKIWMSGGGDLMDNLSFEYIDKDGNIAEVNIVFRKIASFKDKKFAYSDNWDKNWEYFNNFMTQELESLGFEYCKDKEIIDHLLKEINSQEMKYKKKIESEMKERKIKEFDF